jgi:hypothetical protein
MEKTYRAHPLDTTFSDDTGMSRRVFMFAGTFGDIGDRRLTAMRVIGKTLYDSTHGRYGSQKRCHINKRTAPLEIWKWSSMRKGVRFRSCGEPIERRTSAPAPYQATHPTEYVQVDAKNANNTYVCGLL